MQEDFANLTLHMTCYRIGQQVQFVVLFNTRYDVYMVCCDGDSREITVTRFFPDLLPAKIYLMDRFGVPLNVWLHVDCPSPLIHIPGDFYTWAHKICRMLLATFIVTNSQEIYNITEMKWSSERNQIVTAITHLRWQLHKQMPRPYVEWLVQPLVAGYLQKKDRYAAITVYSDLLKLDYSAARRRIEKLYGETD